MHDSIKYYIEVRERQIKDVIRFDDIIRRVTDALDELGEDSDGVGVSGDVCTGEPLVTCSVSVDSSARLAEVLNAFARHGFRRRRPDGELLAEYRTRIYDLTDGVRLHANLTGEQCRLVEVGTKPVYELVCD